MWSHLDTICKEADYLAMMPDGLLNCELPLNIDDLLNCEWVWNAQNDRCGRHTGEMTKQRPNGTQYENLSVGRDRMESLMRMIYHSRAFGKRLRMHILSYGVKDTIDRNSNEFKSLGLDVDTVIRAPGWSCTRLPFVRPLGTEAMLEAEKSNSAQR